MKLVLQTMTQRVDVGGCESFSKRTNWRLSRLLQASNACRHLDRSYS